MGLMAAAVVIRLVVADAALVLAALSSPQPLC